MDPDISIKKLLDNNKQALIGFVRFKVGEGIDKKESDFAAEVKDIVS
jgi:elongation factor Ts